MDNTEDARIYPIGRMDYKKNDYALEELLQFVIHIQSLPGDLAKLIQGITEDDLQKNYRQGSWTVKQIVHHLADSHMHAWIRTKFTLTQDNPTIQPYVQDEWAKGTDYTFNHDASYLLLVGLHQRWSLLLLDCLKKPELLLRTYVHPEHNTIFTLAQLIAQYSWHGRHHLGQIATALGR